MNIRAQIFGREVEQPLLQPKQSKQADTKALTDIRIAREETRRANNRHQDRFRLTGASFTVTYEGRNYDAEVVNLSGGGAMIAAGLIPNIGERLYLNLDDEGSIECAVRWMKSGRLGLEFAHETQLQCSDEDVAALLRDIISRDFPDEKFETNVSPPTVPASEPDDQRSTMRHPLIWSGEILHGSHRWTARLRNISAAGALVQCSGSVRLDSEVMLDLGKAGVFMATVRWAVGDHMGLRFDEPFDVRRLSEARPQVTPPKWLRPDYLESEAQTDSPWDRSWGRMSIDDLKDQLEGFLKR